jgi:ABC-type transport system involved in cytochrome c biogenesis permease component
MNDIQSIIDLIKETSGAAAGGALALASAVMYGLIKLIRIPIVQTLLGKLSPKLTWSSWPKWAAALCVFGLTLLGAFLSALAVGTPWLTAIIGAFSAAVPVALGAMGVDAAVGAVASGPIIKPLPGSPVNP